MREISKRITNLFCHLYGALLITVSCSALAGSETINVAVASNFLPAATEIARRWERQGGDKIRLSSGSTGKLYAQIVNGAPFQVFLAADALRPEKLVQQDLALADSRFTYAIGKLALWTVNAGTVLDAGLEILKTGKFRRLAVANPDTAPYGQAAQQFLEKIGLLDALRPRLVRGENITQAYQYVASGNAELGLVSYAQVLTKPGQGQSWLIPQEYYTPLLQQGVILKNATGRDAVYKFVRFIGSMEIRNLLQEQFGYGV